MCKKVFALQRCLHQDEGGCDQYYAERVADEHCGGSMHGGLPRLPGHCPVVWGVFESEISARINRHAFYDRIRKGPCPNCLHTADLRHLREEAERERRGEFSERVKGLIKAEKDRADAKEGAFMHRVYNEMWDAARKLAAGLADRAALVWGGIEASVYEAFGAHCLAHPDVLGLVYSLADARRQMVVHGKALSREMATVLVGANAEQWDEIVEDAPVKVNVRANTGVGRLSAVMDANLVRELEKEVEKKVERRLREEAFIAANQWRGEKRDIDEAEIITPEEPQEEEEEGEEDTDDSYAADEEFFNKIVELEGLNLAEEQ
ncbi:hypothetical protein CMUS01_13629 [Colletotrichum musicola]|uniref:Uncharacterized protein n=1 Tax=Colletotrichum musicola TaxID=2175873 RepID=A0A8H6MVC0_9PEZI|nr:hypothetical protein CMUS01_13629 [Colletotrichum musicola]